MSMAIVATGAAIGGTLLQANAAEDAEDAQYAAGQQARGDTIQAREQARADNLPFLQTGYQANDLIKALMSSGAITKTPTFADYKQDPSYGFQQSEAAKAIQGSAAARGGLYSGRTMQALGDRSQNIANADYGNWWNRDQQGTSNKVNMLNAIRSGGQAAAGAMGGASMNAGGALANTAIGMGNASAASIGAQGQIIGNALNRVSSFGGMGGGSVGQGSNMFTNKGYFSNLSNGYSNDDVYWN